MERCIGMINQLNLKCKALADTILSHLKSLDLSLEKISDQGCDGASFMSGKKNASKRLRKILAYQLYMFIIRYMNRI